MITPIKKWITVFLAALLLACVSTPVLAEDKTVDFGRQGTITVALKKSEDSDSLHGFGFVLYKVATVCSENNHLVYQYTDAFSTSGIGLDDINASDLATHLAAFAQENARLGIEAHSEGSSVTFSDLDVGLYLLVEKGAVDGYYPALPFLVSLPMTNDAGTAWIYDVDATPKVGIKQIPPIPETTYLTVKKVWEQAGSNIPENVTVTLLRDGIAKEVVVLNNENAWTHTGRGLDASCQWRAVESDVPEGFAVSYSTGENTIVITNTAKPDAPLLPVTLTVKKVWEDSGTDRPTSVTVQLYENGNAYEAVTLSEKNGWMYTWKQLPGDCTWDVKETAIPKGYRAFYSRTDNIITITNAASLIYTGQLIWPIPILSAAGIVFFSIGWCLVFGKRKKNEAV